MRLKAKRIVITGGSQGLGRALATRFAEEGARIAICSRTYDELNRVALDLAVRGHAPVFASCDIADADQVKRFSDLVLSEFGSVDVLVNNASVLGQRIEIVDWTRSAWDRVIDVNVNGLFAVTKAFLPSMIGQRAGSIVNVSSSVGRKGRAGWGAYAVSKFALEGFTQTLADEVRHHGIRVNSVNPGALDTEMRHAAYPDENRDTLKKPLEVTDVFVFLASDESRGTTGQCFDAQDYFKTKKEIV
ncbi:MAG TPA: 3-oxoacyl-ACP reductase [Bacteroidetes bacterium]|nr:MAG: hypothetical protein A2X66_00290 [Ignavibacteria bacterium GWA2_54_16]HCA79485.1 3-oxoacyl-ACP reductase [Bacteroidota bacterium]